MPIAVVEPWPSNYPTFNPHAGPKPSPNPNAGKRYQSKDAVRKHARNQHRGWLSLLPPGAPSRYCRPIHIGGGDGDVEPTELEVEVDEMARRSQPRARRRMPKMELPPRAEHGVESVKCFRR